MNVLLVSATYPEPEEFGLQKDTLAVHYFTKQWVKDGNEVLVVHPYFNGVGKICNFLNIHRLGIRHSCIDGVNVIFGASQIFKPHAIKPFPFQERFLARRIKKYIRNHFPHFTPDVISVHFPFVLGEFVDKFCDSDIPTFAVFHGTDVRRFLSFNYCNKLKWIKVFNARYRQFGFRAPLLLEKCCESFLDKSKSTVILSGLDGSIISDEQTVIEKARRPITKRKLSIIFAGKLVKQKRIDFVLQALSMIKDEVPFVFNIVGDGEELTSLQTTTESLGLKEKVVFVGRVRREELSCLMQKSDVFIMMSTDETLGLVYLEAMAQGCIPIGSKGEGIDGIIKHAENGLLCNPYSTDEVAESIRMIYALSQKEKERYVLNAYYTVNGLTEERMAKKYIEVLKNITDKNDKE